MLVRVDIYSGQTKTSSTVSPYGAEVIRDRLARTPPMRWLVIDGSPLIWVRINRIDAISFYEVPE